MSYAETVQDHDLNDFQRRIGVGERQNRYGRHAGTEKTTVVPREDNGKPAGKQVEHWSGRVDATAFAPSPPVIKIDGKTGKIVD